MLHGKHFPQFHSLFTPLFAKSGIFISFYIDLQTVLFQIYATNLRDL